MAVSINLRQVLDYPGLPERALETLLLLLGILVVSVVGLAPGQTQSVFAIELLVEGLVLTGAVGLLMFRHRLPRVRPRAPVRLPLAPADPGDPGNAAIRRWRREPPGGAGGGLYWTFAGILGAFVCAVMNTWVLLVEIQR